MSFTIELPMPPSANNLFANRADGKGRTKTDPYRDWQRNAVLSIYAQVRADRRIAGPVEVSIQIPFDAPGDCDNRIKPVLDALVLSRRIDDDRNVWRVECLRGAVKFGTATVEVSAWARAAA